MAEPLEEHFLMRFQDVSLAEELRSELEKDSDDDTEEGAVAWTLVFASERVGTLTISNADGTESNFAATLHALPSIVETYKSHNHVNLVKTADVGQLILIHALEANKTAQDQTGELMDLECGGKLNEEFPDGVTVPMKNTRKNVFRKDFAVKPSTIRTVEQQLITIMNGEAPEGWIFEDVQETFVVDESTGKGKWVPSEQVAMKTKKKGK